MFTAEVVGNVVATQKDESLVGRKLLVISPLDGEMKMKNEYLVAVDSVGAGRGERVLVARGSSARRVGNFSESPIDLAIVGIIDEIKLNGKTY